jgi:hypothetical protein
MHRLILTAMLALPVSLTLALTPALAEVTVTGMNGGTMTKSRDCLRTEGQAECVTGTTYTGAGGQTATKERVRSTVPGASTTDVTLTGPDGNTRTRKRLITWGD